MASAPVSKWETLKSVISPKSIRGARQSVFWVSHSRYLTTPQGWSKMLTERSQRVVGIRRCSRHDCDAVNACTHAVFWVFCHCCGLLEQQTLWYWWIVSLAQIKNVTIFPTPRTIDLLHRWQDWFCVMKIQSRICNLKLESAYSITSLVRILLTAIGQQVSSPLLSCKQKNPFKTNV